MALFWALALALVAALVAVLLGAGVALRRRDTELVAARARIAELESAVLRLEATADGDRSDPRAVRVARTAARAVVGTAGRWREGGVSGLVAASLDDLARLVTEDRIEIERVATPDGTVTVLFSDIVDSTARNELLGDRRWLGVLHAHDTVVRREVEARRGHVVKSQGDGYMVVFPDALAGVRAALAIQERLPAARRLRRADIHVRIGLHTGRVLSHDGDYFGRNVALAARVAAHGAADDVLVSDAVRDVIAHAPGLTLELRSTTELKGLAGEHRLWSVAALA
ncbi:adenylate/guanylate cyclase domain-containing protein [Nocardioides sp. BP30]|uniref:adenylate/guanylate cyclase domain-containing protein n=1 Tax=Nocardioides sp. BP30 TaxID=3036374 RepID=UPI002468603E|nr:adenylate/guanylate cyclase domain-containing protein [Nocardioides sp. BP30]WGL51177.1 adenylate/guanylate cyclase domain-containing protein [Nocardioides sp. BP30]